MNIHITNLYKFIDNNKSIDRQKKIANTARFLGFHELGIPVYNALIDTDSEMSKRQDGIISAIEYGDVVVLQLPMENDTRFEDMLINKIEVYSGRSQYYYGVMKIIILKMPINIVHMSTSYVMKI